MGDPAKYLPAPFEEDRMRGFLSSIIPGEPRAVKLLPKSGEYHLVYVLTYAREAVLSTFPHAQARLESEYKEESVDLILRVSGDHITRIKTENEVAIISWLRAKTTIPVPLLLSYSANKENVLGCEYMLFARSPGVNPRSIFDSLSEEQRAYLLDQLIDVLVQLHKLPFHHVGGLKLKDGADGSVLPGAIVEEHFWYDAELREYWPPTESYETLNLIGPFDSYSDFIIESVEKYMHAIDVHESLEFMKDCMGKLQQFCVFLDSKRDLINNTIYCLAHKDLHFGNILIEAESAQITCILDWEFSGVVPYQCWDPHRSFLSYVEGEAGSRGQREFMKQFEHRCKELNVEFLVEGGRFTSKEQESAHRVQNYLRAIVEVCPRGYREDLAKGSWKAAMLAALETLGIR